MRKRRASLKARERLILYKPTIWRVFFLLLSTAYLIPEAIFNAQLVSLIGLGTPDELALEQLEIYGRGISGIGVTLLLADLLPVSCYKNMLRGIVSIVLLTIVVWPTTYFGQKFLVERFLITASTPSEREYAVLSSVFRDALAINAVEVDDLEYDTDALHSSENLTFLALFGGLLYADESLADNLESYKHEIVKQFVQKNAYQKFDQYYTEFSALYQQLSLSYSTYAKGSNQYNQAIADIPRREQVYWKTIEQEVKDGWQQYQTANKAYIARAEIRAQKYGPEIHSFFKKMNQCSERYNKRSEHDRKAKCMERPQVRYKTEISKLGLGYVEPDYWLVTKNISGLENATTTVAAGVLTGGIYTALQLLSLATGGDGGIKDKRYEYTKDPAHYQIKILEHPKFQAQFRKETGYPMGIQNLVAFRTHDTTQINLRKTLTKEGLALPKLWNIQQRRTFSSAVAAKVKGEANLRWKRAMRKKDIDLPINLNWQAYQGHPSIQAKIAQNMGDKYVKNVRADWNQANFKRYVLDPNIKKRPLHYLEMIEGARPHFADGGKFAEAGQQALRSVIIPPISMSISLFLICLTLIKLPIKIIEIKKPLWANTLPKWAAMSIKVLPSLLLVVLPVLFVSNSFTAQANSPVNYFLNKVEQASNPAFAYVLRWTLHAQPVLHPMGLTFEKTTQLYQIAEPLTHAMAAFEQQLPRWTVSDKQQEKLRGAFNENTQLTITSNTENATIRIMNIKPTYQAGMLLSPGNYDIQISAPDYATYRGWHHVRAGQQTLSLLLVPKE